MPCNTSNSRTPSSTPLLDKPGTGPSSDAPQWPFPRQLIRHNGPPPLLSNPTPTCEDMTIELGEAKW